MKHERFVLMMGPSPRRTLVVAMLLAVAACGSDDKAKDELPSAGEDSGSPEDAGRPKDAATERDARTPEPTPQRDSGMVSSGGECGGNACKAPATCSRDGQPHCVCPDGYKDVKGDGSQCDDIDECDGDEAVCDRNANCKNTPGSFECECKKPAYSGDGKKCDCAEGYARGDGDLCLADDGKACGDDLDCKNGACESGICCAQSCENPGTCQAGDGASCEDGKTCKYKTAEDGAECDDGKACTGKGMCKAGECGVSSEVTDCDDKNPCTDDSCEEPSGCKNINNTLACDDGNACTLEDHCLVGICQSSMQKDCSSASDICNLGSCDPANGECKPMPRPASTACNDGNSCTLTDQCTNGSCTGSGNACRENATACTPGTPNTCTCKDGFVAQAGVCVPNQNECATANSCSPDADCFDPSSAGGDLVCTCKPGFTGNGTTCTRTNPCEGNPCGDGRGTCAEAAGGVHTCTCSAGFKAVGETCVCDMGGTWAVRTEVTLRWFGVDGIEDGTDTTFTYLLERNTYDDQGKLSLEVTMCGTTSFDICGPGMPPVLGAEAYSDFIPINVWDLPSMPKFTTTLDLPNALPGQPFVTPNFAIVHGLTLTDPMGTWPTRRQDIAGSSAFDGSAVNGASWVDHDADNQVALTDFAVPPGGIRADGVAPDPMADFGATSLVCPRTGGGAHTDYAYWPALPESGLTPVRITKLFTASRVINGFSGSISSCDAYAGDMTGPSSDGRPVLEARIGGCMRTNGNAETACSTRTIDSLDTTPQNQVVERSVFKAQRVTATGNIDCATARGLNWN